MSRVSLRIGLVLVSLAAVRCGSSDSATPSGDEPPPDDTGAGGSSGDTGGATSSAGATGVTGGSGGSSTAGNTAAGGSTAGHGGAATAGFPGASGTGGTSGTAGKGGGAGTANGGSTTFGGGGSAGIANGGSPSTGGMPASGGASGVACDPIAPTACTGATSKCGFDAATGTFDCEAPGSAGDQQTCTYDNTGRDDCAAGFVCVGQPMVCSKLCDPAKMNADCPSNEDCNLTVHGPNGSSFTVCHPKAPTCDPLAQTCTASGTACYPTSSDAECLPAGMVATGQTCAHANDCLKGAACVSINGGALQCWALCAPGGGAPACASGTCTMLGNAAYGVCM